MKRKIVVLSIGAVFLVCASALFAEDRLVPSVYPTIQAGINAAQPGDTVIVAEGTYTGAGNRDLDFGGSAITVRSADPNNPAVVAATVIDSEGSSPSPHRAFHFHSGETTSSVVAGLTITGGYMSQGGGIYCTGSSPTIMRCVLSGNEATMMGGGLAIESCSPMVVNCIFSGNIGGWYGGGINNYDSSATVKNCVFSGNGASAGGGMANYESSTTIINCTFSGNYADQGGGICNFAVPAPGVSNCVLWDDIAPLEPEIFGDCSVSYSDVQGGYAGEGNIDADPCFANAMGGDYHLLEDSPCIDAGDPAYSPAPGERDIDGEPRVMGIRVDMGADEFTAAAIPVIELSPTEFEFFAGLGGPNPPDQELGIRNSGVGTLNWEISEDCGWLSAEPNSGSSTGETDEVTLSVDISGLAAGFYNCELIVSGDGAAGSPQIVGVTLYVSDGYLHVPGHFGTIQAAIDAAQPGETVIVAPGTYTGAGNRDLDFGGKGITVRSIDPNDPCVVAATTIDCELSEPGFVFHSAEEPDSVVAGLTITNGHSSFGAGICCEHNSNPTISNCTVTGNWGHGIYCSQSSPTIVHCTVTDNSGSGIYSGSGCSPTVSHCVITDNSTGYGGGVRCSGSTRISHCVIKRNSAKYGGGIYCYGNPTITNCIIAENWTNQYDGGGIHCHHGSSPTINSCTITGNSSQRYGGGVCCWENSSVTIRNSILRADTASTGPEIALLGAASQLAISYCDIEGARGAVWVSSCGCTLNWGLGNIDADPFFVDAAAGQYDLSANSFCINGGDPCYSPAPNEADIDGDPRVFNSRLDIGADEFTASVPVIGLSQTVFNFYSREASSNPEGQTLSIRNVGICTVSWEITESCPWVEVDPNSGQSTGDFNEVGLSVDISELTLGSHNCELTVISEGAGNSPQTISVTIYIHDGQLHVPSELGTIQGAIDVANHGDTILVADGTYAGRGNRDLDFKGKAITVRSEDGPENCMIDCQNVSGHRGFYFHSSEDANSIVSGFTITRGNTTCGAGIYCTGSSPKIENCIITNNKAYGPSACPVSPDAYGGGICCTGSSSPIILSCTITNNAATGCDACVAYDQYRAEGGDGYGGAIFIGPNSRPEIFNSTIGNNTAEGGQGRDCTGDWPYMAGRGGKGAGGGIYCDTNSIPRVENCTIHGNTAVGGDGGYHQAVWQKYAEGGRGGNGLGGGIYIDIGPDAGAFIKNSMLASNRSSGGSGGNGYAVEWSIGGDGGGGHGAGIFAITGIVNLNTCTISDNVCMGGSGGEVDGNDGLDYGGGIYGGISVNNCILWNNTPEEIHAGAADVMYSNIRGGWPGTGNISEDPCFVSGPEGDYYLSQVGAGQAYDSPCVDAGSDTAFNLWMDIFTTRTDEIGDAGIVDMGYHYSMPNPADIDGDGDVDEVDYAILASQWRQAPGVPSADIAPPGGNGIVDGLDVELLARNYLWGKGG